jgi:hypothetical protein
MCDTLKDEEANLAMMMYGRLRDLFCLAMFVRSPMNTFDSFKLELWTVREVKMKACLKTP